MGIPTHKDVIETTPKPRLLLVDDEVSVLRTLSRIFKDHNYSVVTAPCTAEAMAIIKSEKIDLIISDNLMSGTFGVDFLKSVRETYPHIKLIMLSGYVPRNSAHELLENNLIDQMLVKPCEAKKILEIVGELLADIS